MIDEDYDFGHQGGLQSQWGLFALLAALIIMGVFWWNDTLNKTKKIDELVRKNRRLETSLEEAESAFASARDKYTAISKRPAAPAQVNSIAPNASLVSTNSKVAETQPDASSFDVDKFILRVKTANSPAELETLDHQAPGIHQAITPLLELTSELEFRNNALISLRMLNLPENRKPEVVATLIELIDANRFGDVGNSKEVNRHAYSLLVLLGDKTESTWDKLQEIMKNDHSPWAGYACVSLGILNRDAKIETRMVELLSSPFETNRLVAVRKIPDFVDAEIARKELTRMYEHETSEAVRQSIVNSMNRLN